MKFMNKDSYLVLGLLFLMISSSTIYLFHAPFQQMNRADPHRMKISMEDMMKKVKMLEKQHSSLPQREKWQNALSAYVYHADYEVNVWNKNQEGIYYANIQKHHPVSMKSPLTNAILKQPLSDDDSIHFITYRKDGESRFGYYSYIPEWEVYISLTGTNSYFENPKVTIWKSILIEIMLVIFALMVFKEIWEKQYLHPLKKISDLLKREYPIESTRVQNDENEYEWLALELESQILKQKQKTNAS